MDNDFEYETDWLLADATEDQWRDEPIEPSAEWDDENIAAIRSEFALMCDAFGSGCGGYFDERGVCTTCFAYRS